MRFLGDGVTNLTTASTVHQVISRRRPCLPCGTRARPNRHHATTSGYESDGLLSFENTVHVSHDLRSVPSTLATHEPPRNVVQASLLVDLDTADLADELHAVPCNPASPERKHCYVGCSSLTRPRGLMI